MNAGSREWRDCEEVMRRIYGLRVREQLMVFETLRKYLGDGVGEETIFDKEIHGRQAALEAMRRVADHWQLDESVAPTTTQHRQAPSEVTEGWSVTRVGEAWGRYRFAQQAFRGEPVAETVAQKSLRRSASGRKRWREDYMSGLREWLETDPASRTTKDYDDYVRQHNSEVLTGERGGLTLASAGSLTAGLGLRWADTLRLCDDEADYGTIRADALRECLANGGGSLGLMSSEGVGHMLGKLPKDIAHMLRRGTLPVPVLILANIRGWYIKDIEALAAERPVPKRQEDELRPQVMSTSEVAAFLGVTRTGLTSMLHQESKSAPTPDGRIAHAHYWMRQKTERWVAEHGKPKPRRPRGKYRLRTGAGTVKQAPSR